MAAGLRCGIDDKFYLNTGNYSVPTWTELGIVQDLTLGLEKDQAEVKKRGNAWKFTLPLHKAAPLEFKMLADTSDGNYATFRDAFINNVILDCAVADAAIATSGTEYFRADWQCYGFKKNQPIGEVNTVDLTLNLHYSTNAPAFTTAS